MPGFVALTWNPNKSEVETGKSGVQGQSWLMNPIPTPIILAKEKKSTTTINKSNKTNKQIKQNNI